VTSSFHSPRSFDPSYSLLGRAFRHWTGDRLRGEALFIVALTGLALMLLMAHYLGWALLKPVLAERPSWQMLFWGAQVGSALVWAALGLVGFRPRVRAACSASALELEQGTRTRTIPYDTLDGVDTVSATTYHRHYRRYAATQVFVSRLPDEVLVLRTPQGPVVVALPTVDEQEALRSHLETAEVEPSNAVPQPHS